MERQILLLRLPPLILEIWLRSARPAGLPVALPEVSPVRASPADGRPRAEQEDGFPPEIGGTGLS